MGRRNEHSREQQREMAIAAAELILVKEGYAGLSMRKVADAIGYTVGSLYLLFENQDDLLAMVNERSTDAVYAHLRDALDKGGTPAASIKRVARAYIEFARNHPNRFRMMFEHSLPPEMQPRETTDRRIQRMFELVQASLRPLLPGESAQRLRNVSAALWSGVHGVGVLAVTGKLKWSGSGDPYALSDFLVDTYLAGLVRAKG